MPPNLNYLKKTQGNQEITQGKLSKLKDFEGQNSRILPKLKVSEIPFPYVDAETAKKKACTKEQKPSKKSQSCLFPGYCEISSYLLPFGGKNRDTNNF